ncbi:MAG: hypothetical protein QOD41_1805 [Cryptosporangiaceae bacterium]|nr:hypothetical protein [Cryptosporangiaceae bacterium]
MGDVLTRVGGIVVLVCDPAGPPMRTEGDAMDVIAVALGDDAEWVAVPAGRMGEGFFDLSTGIAGQILQKFTSYQRRLVVTGDISAHLARSTALRGLVAECNRGRHVWFLDDLDALRSRLEPAAPAPPP